MKKIIFMFFIFFSFVSVSNADLNIKTKFESSLLEQNDDTIGYGNQQHFFTDNGFITIDYDSFYNYSEEYGGVYTFSAYDSEGSLKNKNNITIYFEGNYSVNMFEDNIYMFIYGVYDIPEGKMPRDCDKQYMLFKIDSSANVSLLKTLNKNDLFNDDENIESVSIVDGMLAVLLSKYDSTTENYVFFIKLIDLITFEESNVDYTEENQKKYFFEKYCEKVYGSYNKVFEYGDYSFVTSVKEGVARIDIHINDKSLAPIKSTDYESFGDVVLIDNLFIATIGYLPYSGYEHADLNKKGDLLIYDLKGNLIKKISTNANYHALEVKDNKLLVGRYYVDGFCDVGGLHHSCKVDCITYVQHILYELDIDSYVLGEDSSNIKQPDSSENETNPDTSALAIIFTVIISVFAVILVYVNYKKIKEIN